MFLFARWSCDLNIVWFQSIELSNGNQDHEFICVQIKYSIIHREPLYGFYPNSKQNKNSPFYLWEDKDKDRVTEIS